jgi:hypothetical protein
MLWSEKARFLADISEADIHQIFVVCLTSLVVFILALIAAGYLRRWARRTDSGPPRGFALEELRKLHREGKMSDDEFKRTSALVAQAQKAQHMAGAVDKPTKPKPS